MTIRLFPLALALTAALACAAASPARAGAQETDPLALARAAQRRFEAERPRWLPTTGAWSAGRCDERIGRMCLRLDTDDDWWPSAERPRLVAAREELLAALADAAGRVSDDDARAWILGQRVLYLGEAGRWEDAAALATASCAEPATAGCHALAGLALHALGRFVEAEAAFRAGLADDDRARSAQWLDPEPLLDGPGRDWWRDLPEDARALQLERLWTFADPLLLVPGNDRLTEHLSRWTVARVRATGRNPYSMPWANDLETMLVRYGWELGWERVWVSSMTPSPGADVIGHEDPQGRPLMPPGAALRDPLGADADDWRPVTFRPRELYAPGYAPVLLPGAGQLSVFPRADRFVLVGAYDLPADTSEHAEHGHPDRDRPLAPWAGLSAEAGLFLIPADGAPTPVPGARAAGAEGSVVLEAPAGRWVASLEVWDPALRRAGRMRAGVVHVARPKDESTLSDLMLVRGPVSDDWTLADAAARALPRASFRGAERIGVVWELFGPGGEGELSYELTIERPGAGVLTRAVRRLGLFRGSPARRVAWREAGPEGPGPALRGVDLELGPLEEGPWVVRLEVRAAGRPPLVQERAVELRP